MTRQAPTISAQDVQEYIHRQSRLCDSRIEDAYMRLSGCYGDSKPSAPASRTLSSSMSLPYRKPLPSDTVTRPSTAHECRSTDRKTIEKPRGILKKSQSPVGSVRKRESPDEWFQRIMYIKNLSPLDLCDLFSRGDARKNPLVSLSNVCAVLFDLDPESLNGADPVTEEMEEFLYQFAAEHDGEMMVNIREALRALDIWQSRVTTSAQKISSKLASNPQPKTAILESKNKKLKDVIADLQDANLRLSRQLNPAKLAAIRKSNDILPSTWPPRSRISVTSSVELSPKYKAPNPRKSSSQKGNSSRSGLQVVNLHEQELVEITSKLQFTGVLRLEQLLVDGDADSTGFVSLKQLCLLLAEDFELKVSESRLVEVCLGMNFNSDGQLDYKEFVDVLMDILIYALPDIRESAKKKSIQCLDQYLQSGFPSGREDVRQLLDALCSKYDLEGGQIIPIKDLVRVFHEDLVKYHEDELPFTLEEHETIQLARPFIQHKSHDSTSEGFVAYPELLDAILGPFPTGEEKGAKQLKRALSWEFWHNILMALCGGDARMKQKIVAQLVKIMTKVDPDKTFTISTRHFKRIFERHLSPEDMEILAEILATSETVSDLRYDVLLKLVFGSPELHDKAFFKSIRTKILREEPLVKELTTRGSSHKLTIQDFHETFIVQAEEPLTTIEMLFLFASIDSDHDGSIHAKTLQNFLTRSDWSDTKRHTDDTTAPLQAADTEDIEMVKKLVAKCCSGYDLQRSLDTLGRNSEGWISQAAMLLELSKMLHKLGVVGVHQSDLKHLVQNISQHTIGDGPRSALRDGILVHCDAFFDALLDWNSLIIKMRLSDSLVEVKKVFEKFDREHNGTIRSEDWNKAYRLICDDDKDMSEWEVRVLQRRFPGHTKREETIDYARLIVFLLDFQQRHARKTLQIRVLKHFQQRVTSTMSTAKMERLFQALDTDKKGYFNAADLKTYLSEEFAKESEEVLEEDKCSVLLNSADALASVIHLLAGERLAQSYQNPTSSDPPAVVTFKRFCHIVSLLSNEKHSISSSGNRIDHRSSRIHPSHSHNRKSSELADADNEKQTISSLRVLEITISEIASQFVDSRGNLQPARAFHYFSLGSTVSGRTPPGPPLRRSLLSNSTVRSSGLSRTTPKKQRVPEASNLDPLTPSRLKQTLQSHHNIEVSTHLISQFFLHIGSPSKYFLDLQHFAQWAVPLSVELQDKVREVVRQMLVKGKGGGGRVGLDRFLVHLQRRIQDSPHYRSHENTQVHHVPMQVLLSKLHLLNISLHKRELLTLLRHFGMEEDLEAVDYARFVKHLHELAN